MKIVLAYCVYKLQLIECADSIGHGGTCPHFYKWLGTGDYKTANKKLAKLY